MTTRLHKPVTRIVSIDGSPWNVTLDYAGVTFRAYRSPARSELLLPYGSALNRAAWLNGEKSGKRKPKVKRGSHFSKGRVK